MLTLLSDHDIEGQAWSLWGAVTATGWLDILPLRFAHFVDVGLSVRSTDRAVWHFAQANQMLLLTNNRNMEGQDSLEQTIRDELSSTSLPVITIGRIERITESQYRTRCAERLLEVVVYLDDYLGTGRIFIP